MLGLSKTMLAVCGVVSYVLACYLILLLEYIGFDLKAFVLGVM